jgi:hypothetical protein
VAHHLSRISTSSLAATLHRGSIASIAGFLAYFHLPRHLSPVAL